MTLFGKNICSFRLDLVKKRCPAVFNCGAVPGDTDQETLSKHWSEKKTQAETQAETEDETEAEAKDETEDQKQDQTEEQTEAERGGC